MGILDDVGNAIGRIGGVASVGAMLFGSGPLIGFVPVDTFTKVDHKSTATLSKYPVETGAYYADHIIVEPVTVTVSGIIVDDSFADLGPAGAVAALATSSYGFPVSKSSASWQMLRLMQTTRMVFALAVGVEYYPQMMISELTAVKDKSACNALRFTAKCTEVITVAGSVGTREESIEAEPGSGSPTPHGETDIAKGNRPTADRAAKPVSGGMKKPVRKDLITKGLESIGIGY